MLDTYYEYLHMSTVTPIIMNAHWCSSNDRNQPTSNTISYLLPTIFQIIFISLSKSSKYFLQWFDAAAYHYISDWRHKTTTYLTEWGHHIFIYLCIFPGALNYIKVNLKEQNAWYDFSLCCSAAPSNRGTRTKNNCLKW